MKNETCIHGGIAPVIVLDNLHHSQAGTARHRCPTCAYEFGYSLGSSQKWENYNDYISALNDRDIESCNNNSIVPIQILSSLGENQGGTGRHKCCNCAFKEGFEDGLATKSNQDVNINLTSPPTKIIKTKNGTGKTADVDYIERELKNQKLGYLGELSVFEHEKKYLRENGKPELSEKVRHVSKEIGDGLGFDILSYDLKGNEKKIEVKTTRGDKSRPFYISRNELEISTKNSTSYFLYRLYNFDPQQKSGEFYIIKGNLQDGLVLDPITFLAYPKT